MGRAAAPGDLTGRRRRLDVGASGGPAGRPAELIWSAGVNVWQGCPMASSPLTGLAVAVGVLVLATLVGLWWRARDGRIREIGPAGDRDDVAQQRIGPAELRALGATADGPATTLLQFSSTFCAPCRVARRVCQGIASARDGVTHLEIDAESHLDLARSLGVWRTPTVLVVDPAGRIRYRSTGAPDRAQLDEAVGATLVTAADGGAIARTGG
jgi:hypothetical protein